MAKKTVAFAKVMFGKVPGGPTPTAEEVAEYVKKALADYQHGEYNGLNYYEAIVVAVEIVI